MLASVKLKKWHTIKCNMRPPHLSVGQVAGSLLRSFYNDTSTLMGNFVSFPIEREKMERRAIR